MSSVEMGQFPRNQLLVPDINEPDDLPVGGVQERHLVPVPVAHAVERPLGISFRLFQHVLRSHRHLLGFDDPQELAVNEQSVISRTVGCRELLHRMMAKHRGVEPILVCDNFPRLRQRFQPAVDPLFSCFPLRFRHLGADYSR